MDLEKIKSVVNSSFESHKKEKDIIQILADDPKVIPTLLKILEQERLENNNLIIETNAELSRALVTLVEPDIKKTTGDFVIGQIKAYYHKWQHKVKCCFKFTDLP